MCYQFAYWSDFDEYNGDITGVALRFVTPLPVSKQHFMRKEEVTEAEAEKTEVRNVRAIRAVMVQRTLDSWAGLSCLD